MIHFHNCRNILEHQKNGTHPNDFEYLNRPRMFYNLNFLIETFMIKTLIEFCTWTVASRNPTARQNSYFLIMIYKIEGDLSCDGICMWFLDSSKSQAYSITRQISFDDFLSYLKEPPVTTKSTLPFLSMIFVFMRYIKELQDKIWPTLQWILQTFNSCIAFFPEN